MSRDVVSIITEYVEEFGEIVVLDQNGHKYGIVVDAMWTTDEPPRVILHFMDDPKAVGSGSKHLPNEVCDCPVPREVIAQKIPRSIPLKWHCATGGYQLPFPERPTYRG